MKQCANIPLNCANANQLVPNEVRVMRRGDIIVWEGTCHVMPDLAMLIQKGRVVSGEQKGHERFEGHDPLPNGWTLTELGISFEHGLQFILL